MSVDGDGVAAMRGTPRLRLYQFARILANFGKPLFLRVIAAGVTIWEWPHKHWGLMVGRSWRP